MTPVWPHFHGYINHSQVCGYIIIIIVVVVVLLLLLLLLCCIWWHVWCFVIVCCVFQALSRRSSSPRSLQSPLRSRCLQSNCIRYELTEYWHYYYRYYRSTIDTTEVLHILHILQILQKYYRYYSSTTYTTEVLQILQKYYRYCSSTPRAAPAVTPVCVCCSDGHQSAEQQQPDGAAGRQSGPPPVKRWLTVTWPSLTVTHSLISGHHQTLPTPFPAVALLWWCNPLPVYFLVFPPHVNNDSSSSSVHSDSWHSNWSTVSAIWAFHYKVFSLQIFRFYSVNETMMSSDWCSGVVMMSVLTRAVHYEAGWTEPGFLCISSLNKAWNPIQR